MKGGTPGYYPSFAASVVPLRNLWDPIGFTKWMDAETQEAARVKAEAVDTKIGFPE